MIVIKKKLEELGFHIGSRVVFVGKDPWNSVKEGESGVVCDYHDFDYGCNIGVEWESEGSSRHNCMGTCRNRHGRYVPHTSLALENYDLGEIEESDLSIDTLFNTTS